MCAYSKQDGMLYIVRKKAFNTMSSLIAYYRAHSLEAYFPSIPTHLAFPFGDQNWCLAVTHAKYDFEPQGADELAMKVGDEVEVVAKAGAWWTVRSFRGSGKVPGNYLGD
jgi:hypothetical protein